MINEQSILELSIIIIVVLLKCLAIFDIIRNQFLVKYRIFSLVNRLLYRR